VVTALDLELARALAPEPGQRHGTVTELFEAIEQALIPLGGTPSLPVNRPTGGIVVRQSAPPATDPAFAAFDPARPPRNRSAPAPAGSTELGPFVAASPPLLSLAGRIAWRCVTAALDPGAFRCIAVGSDGQRAAAFGARVAFQWIQGHWTPLSLPEGVSPSAVRAATWHDGRLFVAGAGGRVSAIGDNAGSWSVQAPDITFHGVAVDAAGIVLAGERPTPTAPGGVVAEIPFGGGGAAWKLTYVKESGPLLASLRFAGGILACGVGGALAFVSGEGQPVRVVHACGAPLTALLATGENLAVAVGGGGFVLRVSAALDAELDAIQTTRDLYALARSPDGTLWCAGDAGRVLRRAPTGWVRMGTEGADARVLALAAGDSRLLAFCDDGSVFEGRGL
jgi:hypothetical protein